MSKVGSMTLGLVLIFMGIQLYLVKSYLLTPTATQMVNDYFDTNNGSQFSTGTFASGNNGGLFSGNSGTSGGPFRNGSFLKPKSSQGQLGRYPGQSWPYYNSNAGGGGSVFQNSSAAAPANSLQPFGIGAGIGPHRKRFVPPKWIMWPVLFVGCVFFLHGVALRP